MKKQYKRLVRHKVTFEGYADSLALAYAKLGQSNQSIHRKLGDQLTDSQITYRLSKAKRAEENDRGYRVDWRNGTSPLVQQVIRDLVSVLQADIKSSLPQKIVHPTPGTVKL